MPHSNSAKKRLRQDERLRTYNKGIRTGVKSAAKKLTVAIETEDKAAAQVAFRAAVSTLDRAGKKGAYHKNTLARKKSKLAREFNELG